MINIVFEENKNRSAAYDGDKEVGKGTFTVDSDTWRLDYVWVDEMYRGNKIAEDLVRLLVEEARKQNKKIFPICSYAAREFSEKSEYSDVWKK